MNWKEAKRIINSDPEVVKALEENEEEYQIARHLIRARLEKKITQERLAELVNTKQSNISRLESGKANPSIKFLETVAKVLGKKMVISFVAIDKETDDNGKTEAMA